MAEWTADIDVDAPLAARLVRTQFPELATATVEPFGVGWDNAAFLMDGHVVFRFPRRRIVAGLIEREVAILPSIAPRLPLAISAPHFIGKATGGYPWIFAGYELIDGSTACSVVLSDKSRTALAQPLARFLRALHDVEPAEFVARGLPPDEIGRLDHHKRLGITRKRIATLTASGHFEGEDIFTAWLDAHPPPPLGDAERRLVHGDLYARHILLDDRARPTGIIDWGDVHLGDPALDIAIAHLILPSSAHEVFRAAYGPIDDRTWNTARYRAIYHAILELDYGIREDDAGMREIGSAALRLIRAAIVSAKGI
jgi:aminoglycoside phosphotransferase (APT) family kinase protein